MILLDLAVESKGAITKDVLMRNIKFLEEEIDAKCFVDALPDQDYEQTKHLRDKILSSKSRSDRNKALIEFLSKEQDVSWFVNVLHLRYGYLTDILSKQINASTEVTTG